MIYEYSAAICPPPELVAIVKDWKDLLAGKIGGFASRSALAHLSLLAFEAGESDIERAIAFLQSFCQKRAPFTIHFDGFGSYAGGAFFLSPDEASKRLMKPIMKAFNAHFPLRATKFYDPHMSIARELNSEKVAVAKALFASIKPDLAFECNSICLRRKEIDHGQFEIVNTFAFHGQHILPDDYVFQPVLF